MNLDKGEDLFGSKNNHQHQRLMNQSSITKFQYKNYYFQSLQRKNQQFSE